MPDNEHRERLLNRLSSIISRCQNPKNARYLGYGGRGITVYQAWVKNRFTFLAYVQTLPGWDDPDLELDRIDNDGNYEPGNIRFVTRRENVHNRRKMDNLSQRIIELEKENEQLRAEIARLRHS
jgi:hypothetical protein